MCQCSSGNKYRIDSTWIINTLASQCQTQAHLQTASCDHIIFEPHLWHQFVILRTNPAEHVLQVSVGRGMYAGTHKQRATDRDVRASGRVVVKVPEGFKSDY